MKQTLKIGAMLLVVAALATTGIAVAQSGDGTTVFQAASGETTTDEATTAEAAGFRARIAEWLAPLVEDGTLTETQADAVADTLADAMPGFPGHMGRGLEAIREAADFLGLEPAEVAEALRDGQTLAEIAVAQGKTAEALVDYLAGVAAEHLDELVADGRITAEEKAERLAQMTEHLTDLVNGEIPAPPMGGPGMGRDGRGGHGPCMDGDGDDSGIEDLGA